MTRKRKGRTMEEKHSSGQVAESAETDVETTTYAPTPANAEAHEPSAKRKTEDMSPAAVSRRTLVIGAGSTAALLVLGGLRYAGHNPLVHPPGGQDEKHLVSACIRCERCYEACPRKIIVPAHIEDGLLGMRAPQLKFDDNYCNFCAEENGGHPRCVEVCPTGALDLAEDATAATTILGLAVLDQRTCLAYRDTACKFCYDACVAARGEQDVAIVLTAVSGSSGDGTRLQRPSVDADKCNGCGACESECVSLKAGSIASGATERAIVVRPLELV